VQSRPAGPLTSPAFTTCAFAFLLVVLSFCVYYPARSQGYVNYDDNIYVTDNEHVKEGLTWDTVQWAFTTFDAGNWHPVTWLSHALDFQLYDLRPAGHHETNLVLHAANSVLLFLVLLTATGYAGRSLMVAALFAVHPLNVEPVVWIAERKTLLSMFFFLAALGAYRWYVAKPNSLRYCAMAVLFAVGLMAKPQVITFPCVLLLWDYWPLGRFANRRSPSGVRQTQAEEASGEKRIAISDWRSLLLEKLPLFAIAIAESAMTMRAQDSASAVLPLSAFPLSMRLSNALVSYVKYLHKTFWPVRLAPMYPHPANLLQRWQVYAALFILLAITFAVWEQRERRRYLLVGWLWFVGTLVPMIGLVQVGRQAMADRYAYLPLIGIFIMICWTLGDWAEQRHIPAALLPVAGAIAVTVLMFVSRHQIGYWADNQVLWTHTIEVTLPNYIAEDNLGGTLLKRKQAEEAIVHFRRAAAIHPTDPISAFNIGYYQQQHGDLRGAIEQYKQAVVLTSRSELKVLALENMGYAYRDLGDAEQARRCFDEARTMKGY
jgi:hypothetical protein